ncbi:MAG: helix-turn-helix domain-containing protein [Fimbriimonadaceae bacterium]|nr:helix-turn-helix domain-containing protein [Fimbriimonadaceae bacterium]
MPATQVVIDPEGIAIQADSTQPRMLRAPGRSSATAWLTQIAIGPGNLHYTELKGHLINLASSTGSDLVVGTLVSGRAKVFLNGDRYELQPWQSVLGFPGDEAAQFLSNSNLFTLRIPVTREVHFRIVSLPYQRRLKIRRLLSPDDAEDYRRLLVFFCEESDRTFRPNGDPSLQSRAIGLALRARVDTVLGASIEPALDYNEELVRICLACESLFPSRLSRRLGADEMAKAASCSVRQLYRAFDAVANSSPAAYVARRRIYHARALLLNTLADPLGEAARQCGFSSRARLRKAYEAEFGEDPDETLKRRELLVRSEETLGRTR